MPKLSIGMPVFNGENYLRQALDSLLSQTFTDFELIVSDNASTDATQSICQELAAHDARLKYYRADKNHGASWNHDFVITKASGEYFKLAAHDDVCLPQHLEKCVTALDANPDCVLAYTQTDMMMQGDLSVLQRYQDEVELQHDNPAIRFGDLIDEAPPAFPIFGVVRLAALRSIPLFEAYKASDRVVLTRLALIGRFIEIPEPLFQYRWHASNASNLMNQGSGFYSWWNPNKGQGRVYPELRLAWEHLRSPFLVKLSWQQRRACLKEAWRWIRLNKKKFKAELGQLLGKPVGELRGPNLFERAMQRRQRAVFKAMTYDDWTPAATKLEE